MKTCSMFTFYHITHRCTVSLQNVVANEFVNSQPVKPNLLDSLNNDLQYLRITVANLNKTRRYLREVSPADITLEGLLACNKNIVLRLKKL